MFVPKTQEVIFTKGVMIFHVPRRTISPDKNYKNLISPIPQFEQIPSHILRNERINSIEISFDEVINVKQEPYFLRSAVFLETHNDQNTNDEIVIGTGALIRKSDNQITGDYWVYSPRLAQSDTGKSEQLMQKLYQNNAETDDPIDLLSTRATIFIYAKGFNN
jgi:hypothetical protein